MIVKRIRCNHAKFYAAELLWTTNRLLLSRDSSRQKVHRCSFAQDRVLQLCFKLSISCALTISTPRLIIEVDCVIDTGGVGLTYA